MTIYKIKIQNTTTEFSTLESAQDFATQNSVSHELIEQEERSSVPTSIPDVTPRQIRQALILSGVSLSDIEIALDSLPEPTKSLARTEWEYSISFQRSRPLVAQVGAMLGWTDTQLDDLWLFAGTL